jgi:phage terminase large subunit-like protein
MQIEDKGRPLTREEKLQVLAILEERERRAKGRKLYTYFPETGPLRRELYAKHLKFFEAGAKYRERCFMAANRVGKTESGGGYEFVMHLTGLYPAWWTGRRFDRPISAWAAGDTGKTVREIIQFKLLGRPGETGTGLIPQDMIIKTTAKSGISDAVDTVLVKHASGGTSQAVLKSYDQRRESFQGTEQDVIWLDEEPGLDIYTECLLRTMTNNGLIMLTFTPLQGLTETVMQFLPNGEIQERGEGSKCVVMASWADVPHLTPEVQAELLASIPPFQRDARSKGIPQLGSGAIYPVPETEFLVDPMAIPEHWPRAYGLDVGWNRTAAIFGAIDRDNDILYLTGEHYRGQAEPAIHAQALKAPGDWIPGVIDPASRGRTQTDGIQLLEMYKNLGLDLEIANNAVESGLYEVWQRLSTGRLKVFRSCTNWLSEFRLYRRDEKGRIVKVNDHLMDCTRYLVMSGIERAKTKPKPKAATVYNFGGNSTGWMG